MVGRGSLWFWMDGGVFDWEVGIVLDICVLEEVALVMWRFNRVVVSFYVDDIELWVLVRAATVLVVGLEMGICWVKVDDMVWVFGIVDVFDLLLLLVVGGVLEFDLFSLGAGCFYLLLVDVCFVRDGEMLVVVCVVVDGMF